ncbi:MAG: hypothetical protein KBF62_02715 [Candidatus Pacebacteria bacterium]|nr:hypothetical protein [Candidatus Paceibacterota bacterium]MBP9058525.1 hypothetical protein [Candidatus Paceibacterota bacterium]MBP9770025.1 hypothetical protein [Candidatus Paceibacterota bacterium]
MALTKNQARWAEIYIECEDDRKKIIDGKDPLEILEERSEEIRRYCHLPNQITLKQEKVSS